MEHVTRCAWIQQSDILRPEREPYLCGAAAAQMILYGRDDAKYQSGNGELKDSEDRLRTDQQSVWKSIIRRSKQLQLPEGATYSGEPEWEQVREALTWTTFPHALAAAITKGFSVEGERVAGVKAEVRTGDQAAIQDAIIDSLDRDVAVALLVERHWVVVYRYVEIAEGVVEIFYRDGLHAQISDKWTQSSLASALVEEKKGIFGGVDVAVTAASSVPVRRDSSGTGPGPTAAVGAGRSSGVPPTPAAPPVTSAVSTFPSGLGVDLAARLGVDKAWELSFAGTQMRYGLKVRGLAGKSDYYLVDYVLPPGPRNAGAEAQRTGRLIVDAQTLEPKMTAGIEHSGQQLPVFVGPNELAAELDKFDGFSLYVNGERKTLIRSQLRVDPEPVWRPCDQSSTPFLPFYRVHETDAAGRDTTMYLRIDGRLFAGLTQQLAG
jgi:hypothetical protein